jgi:hypothetical protein
MFNDLQNSLDTSVRKMAENNAIKKLNKKGMKRKDIRSEDFNELVSMEMDLIKEDGKKVGAGIGIGMVLTILSGGIL